MTAALDSVKLRVSAPIECAPLGRGFYQREEELLYVHIGHSPDHVRFFSQLESPTVRLDIDREGRLIFIEVAVPKQRWQVDPEFSVPPVIPFADVRWLNFRSEIRPPEIYTDTNRSRLCLVFSDNESGRKFHLADSIIIHVTDQNTLGRIWITDITDDSAGHRLATFRRSLRIPEATQIGSSLFKRQPAL